MKLIEFTVLLSAALAEMQNLKQNPKFQLLEYVRPSVRDNKSGSTSNGDISEMRSYRRSAGGEKMSF